MQDDKELVALKVVVDALTVEGLDDDARRRIIQYVNQRCIKPSPPVSYQGLQGQQWSDQHTMGLSAVGKIRG